MLRLAFLLFVVAYHLNKLTTIFRLLFSLFQRATKMSNGIQIWNTHKHTNAQPYTMHNIHYTPKQLATDAKVRDPEYSDFFALFEVNYSCCNTCCFVIVSLIHVAYSHGIVHVPATASFWKLYSNCSALENLVYRCKLHCHLVLMMNLF